VTLLMKFWTTFEGSPAYGPVEPIEGGSTRGIRIRGYLPFQ
jgi:hypothetical protein